MQAPARSRALKRSRRVSFLKRDKEGVASTVGTIMALLVFLAFMAMITNSYVPAWMTDNERQHMNQVIDQFGQLKGKVDSMIVEMEIKGTSTTKMYAPIALGSAGVPLFAVPTAGILYYYPMGSNATGSEVEFDYEANGETLHMDTTIGGGKVEVYSPNRYYVQQTIAYENGAILIKQGSNSTIRGYPGLDMYITSDEVDVSKKVIHVSYTEINLIGSAESIAGSDATGLNIDLVYIDAQTYVVEGGQCRLSFTTMYEQAWTAFLKELMNTTGMVSGTDFTIDSSMTSSGAVKIDLMLYSQTGIVIDYNRAMVSMSTLS